MFAHSAHLQDAFVVSLITSREASHVKDRLDGLSGQGTSRLRRGVLRTSSDRNRNLVPFPCILEGE